MTDEMNEDYTFEDLSLSLQTGDSLFKAGEIWYENALPNYIYDKWDRYVAGYKEAADILCQRTIDKPDYTNQRNIVIFPIVFLYRHYLELRLKRTIRMGNQFLRMPSNHPEVHKLDKLWSQCKSILDQIDPNMLTENTTELEIFAQIIDEFSKVDEVSQEFRYPVTKDNNPSLADLKAINLPNLKSTMQKLANFLMPFDEILWQYRNNYQDDNS